MRQRTVKVWVSLATGVFLAAATLFLWLALKKQEQANQEQDTRATLTFVATRVRSQSEARFQSLRRMANRWSEWQPSQDRWERDASLAYDAASFEGVDWVQLDHTVLWSVPPDRRERLRGVNIASNLQVAQAARAARDEQRLKLTPPFILLSGKLGFRAFVPVASEGRHSGYISGVFDVREFFQAILEGIAPEYGIQVYYGGEPLYSRPEIQSGDKARGGLETAVMLDSMRWTVRVWPTPETLQRSRSPLPTVILFFGLISSLGASMTLYFALAERENALALSASNRQLQEETEARERIAGQLRQTQKMEAVGRLAAGVAHDFNNLLGVIIGHTELLGDRVDRASPAQQNLAEIHKAAQAAADLTRQLLAFSRQQVLEPRVLDLNAVVRDVERLLRRLIHENVELNLRLAPEAVRVKADPSQIQQVLMNLAINARDAMPDGGMLTIGTNTVELDESYTKSHPGVTPGRFVMLSVSDTGMGMDKETLARIFEPFFSTKEKGKGTGLGLATVYGIVKQSGGFIWAYSERFHGATFKVYLPQVFDPVETAPPPSAAPAGGHETVLLVEDEPALRELVGVMLRAGGYTVLEADTVNHAEELARQHSGPLHLLLTDVVMPGRSGRELAQQIAAIRPDTKVLYISGYTDDAIVQHGVLEAGVAFLQKPFTKDALLRMVRKVLGEPAP